MRTSRGFVARPSRVDGTAAFPSGWPPAHAQTLQHASSRPWPARPGRASAGALAGVSVFVNRAAGGAMLRRRLAQLARLARLARVGCAPRSALRRARRRSRARASSRSLAEEGWDAVVLHSGAPGHAQRLRRPVLAAATLPALPALAPPRRARLRARGPARAQAAARPHGRRRASGRSLRLPRATAFERACGRRHRGGRDACRGSTSAEVGWRSSGKPRPAPWPDGASEADACPPALVKRLDALRTTKTPYEVACIAEANRRARAGHDALRDAFRAGDASELDLHLLYLRATAQDDWETPYKNIVALGANAATLHHVAYGRQASSREAESLLVDAGATCRGYAADITRTWCKGARRRGERLRAARHGQVEAMQQRLCAAVRVGAALRGSSTTSPTGRWAPSCGRRAIARGSVDAIVASGVTRAFYPHGLGHSLGLQTHDVGCGLRAPRAGQSVPPQHERRRRRPGVHDRAGRLLHRAAPRRRCAPSPRAGWSTGRWSTRSRRSAACASRTTCTSWAESPRFAT